VTTQEEPLGSASEEAARLFAAMQDWAKRNGVRLGGLGVSAAGSADETGGGSHGDHDWADGSAACRLCPLCQLIALTRDASPEVIDHLSAAAESLLAAARAALLAYDRRNSGSEPVERIDIG
jgi:hypothetical protein